jgi:hypothetical protein
VELTLQIYLGFFYSVKNIFPPKKLPKTLDKLRKMCGAALRKKVFLGALQMIKYWTTHKEYLDFLSAGITHFLLKDAKRLASYKHTLEKLSSMNLDTLYEALKPHYSSTGRPAINQPEIFRSFILMIDQKETSVSNWCAKVNSDDMLALFLGCTPGKTPPLGSYYDFIDRLWLCHKSIEYEKRKRLHLFTRKPSKVIKQGKKMPNVNAGVVTKIKNFLAKGRSFHKRPERLIQKIFSLIAVEPSIDLGLIEPKKLTVAGDGTSVHCRSSSRGVKVCECRSNGIYNCKCNRRFADPDARWGFDSYLGHYFFGHTLYAFSYHNPKLAIDLPLVMRFVDANRHDSVSGLVSLAELRELTPQLPIENVCFDSANDNYSTYELLKVWGIKPFIDLNREVGRKPTFSNSYSINTKGIPVCMAGIEMVYNGNCKNRSRIKFRCPLKCGKVATCGYQSVCSPSAYGRVVYTKPDDDLRLFTPVPRGSKEFKRIYKNRTSAERINNRILNDYMLHRMRIRGKKRFSFLTMIIGTNIHLDARLKAVTSAHSGI